MITLDFANCLDERVGEHGLAAASLADDAPAATTAAQLTESLDKTRGAGWERWRSLPFKPMRDEHLQSVSSIVERCAGRFDNLIVLGIGGSALGNIALQCALNPATHNLLSSEQRRGPRLFVLDNVDPNAINDVLNVVESLGGLERTVVNVISKSGETAETAAQFMLFRNLLIDRLGKEKHAEHIVATTDPAKGTMRQICEAEGYVTLPVPDGVGGRFSVLSPVGLFSAAMCGIDIEALLDGAAQMDERCSRAALSENPAAMLATLLVRLGRERGKENHILMPYANNLYLLADWFRQLWAESLGKRVNNAGDEVFEGFTPIKALGATDQHSQVQLYREGPNDKAIGLIEVDDFGPATSLEIPSGMGVDNLRYLEGARFSNLLNAEKRATEYALVESQRPNFTLRFPTVDEHHVGEFIQLWQIATAYAGLMLEIDAFDQPAVELGKQATFGLMGRDGYAEFREKTDAALAPTDYVV